MGAIASAVVTGIKAVGTWLGSNIGAVSSAGTAYAGVKTAETSEKALKQQSRSLKEQNKKDADAIAVQRAKALAKRKMSIRGQRKQILGAGDSNYTINPTGSTGVTDTGASITGETLG